MGLSCRQWLHLLLFAPLFAGCAANSDLREVDEQLRTEMLNLEWELAAREEINQEILLTQSEELRNYYQELTARLERIEKRLISESNAGDNEQVLLSCPPPEPQEKLVFGRLERVEVRGLEGGLKARVDTGATTSSLHAQNVTEFERDGERWVRFETFDRDDKPVELEAPVARYIRIRQASSEELDRRPVVKLPIRLGRIEESTEFSLTDRDDMLYPMLLGRSFFMDIAVVDVSRKFVETKHVPKAATETAEAE